MNSTVTLTRFAHPTAKASKADSFDFALYAPVGEIAIQHVMAACLEDRRERLVHRPNRLIHRHAAAS